MSEAAPTFSQPSSPTRGLANYDLERGTKRLYPGLFLLRRMRRWRVTKGAEMAVHDLATMLEVLEKSVLGIVASEEHDGTPREDLLRKSFAEFGEHLNGVLAKDGATVADEVANEILGQLDDPDVAIPARVAALGHYIGERVDLLLKDGTDAVGATQLTPTVASILSTLAELGNIATRASVNDHVRPLQKGENTGDGTFKMALQDGAEILIQTDLEDDLARYATDPAILADALAQNGLNTLALATGERPAALAKRLVQGDSSLAKRFPSAVGAASGQAPGPAGNDVSGASPAPGNDGTDDGSGDGTDDGQNESPLDILGRLLAAAMIQLDHIQQMVEGGGLDGPDDGQADGSGGLDNGNVGTQQPAGRPKPDQPPRNTIAMGKSAGFRFRDAVGAGSAPAEGAEVDRLRKQVDGLRQDMAKLASQPAGPSAPMRAMPGPDKSDDLAGASGDPAVEIAAELAKMSDSERAVALVKLAQRAPKRGGV